MGAVPGEFDTKTCGPTKEGNLPLGHLRPSQFSPMSRQHIILVLYLKPYAAIDLWMPSYQFKLCC